MTDINLSQLHELGRIVDGQQISQTIKLKLLSQPVLCQRLTKEV